MNYLTLDFNTEATRPSLSIAHSGTHGKGTHIRVTQKLAHSMNLTIGSNANKITEMHDSNKLICDLLTLGLLELLGLDVTHGGSIKVEEVGDVVLR